MDPRVMKEIKRGYPINSRIKIIESELMAIGKVAGYTDDGKLKVNFEFPSAESMVEVAVADVVRFTPKEYKTYVDSLKIKAMAAQIAEDIASEPEVIQSGEVIPECTGCQNVKILQPSMQVGEVIAAAEKGTQFEIVNNTICSPAARIIADVVSNIPEINTFGTTTGRIQTAEPNQSAEPRMTVVAAVPATITVAPITTAPTIVIVGEAKGKGTLADIIRTRLLKGEARGVIAKDLGTSYQYVYSIDKKLPRK